MPTLQELIEHQRQIEQLENQISCHSTEASSLIAGSNSKAKLAIHRMPERLLVRRDKVISVLNRDNYFAVEKKDGAQSFSLLAYLKSGGVTQFNEAMGFQYASVHPLTTVAGGYDTVEYMSRSSFQMIGSRVVQGGLIAIDFTSKHYFTRIQNGPHNPVSGTFWIDPKRQFCIVKERIELTVAKTGELVIYNNIRSLDDQADGIKVIAYEIQVGGKNSDQPYQIQKYSYNYAPQPPAAESEFTLDYYNLATPNEDVYEDRGRYVLLWFSIGIVCLILSLFLIWIVRRRRRQS